METVEDIDTVISQTKFGKFQWILLIVLGIHAAGYGFQIMNITILGPFLYCSWKLRTPELVFLTDSVYIGNIVGYIVLGWLSDNYGRKTCLILSECGLVYAGLMSSLAPHVYWLCLMQLLSGLFTSGLLLSLYPLLSELTPTEYRGLVIPVLDVFCGLGYMAVTIFSYVILSLSNWRYYLFFPSVVLIVLLLSLLWVPESPRFLLLHNEKIKCLEVINRITKMNNTEMISDVQDISQSKSSFRDLIHPNYLITTILTCILCLICYLSFYSLSLIIVFINGRNKICRQKSNKNSHLQSSKGTNILDDSCCTVMKWLDYETVIISNVAQILVIPILIISINCVGRKKTFAIFLGLCSAQILLLNLCLEYSQLNLLLFFLRGTVTALRTLCIIYVTEVYPTTIRSLGLGCGNTFGRFGSLLSPIIVDMLMIKYSFFGGTIVLFVLSIGAFVLSFYLPYETKFRQLHDTVSEVSSVMDLASSYGSVHKK